MNNAVPPIKDERQNLAHSETPTCRLACSFSLLCCLYAQGICAHLEMESRNRLFRTCAPLAYSPAKRAASPTTVTANNHALTSVEQLKLPAALACSRVKRAASPAIAIDPVPTCAEKFTFGSCNCQQTCAVPCGIQTQQVQQVETVPPVKPISCNSCLQTCQAGCKPYETCNCQQSCANVCQGNYVVPQPVAPMPLQPAPIPTVPAVPQFPTLYQPQFILTPCQKQCIRECGTFCGTSRMCLDSCQTACGAQCSQVQFNTCQNSCQNQCGGVCSSRPCMNSCNAQCRSSCSTCTRTPCVDTVPTTQQSTCMHICQRYCMNSCQSIPWLEPCQQRCQDICSQACDVVQQIVKSVYSIEVAPNAAEVKAESKKGNLHIILMFLFFLVAVAFLSMLIGFWILLFHLYSMAYVMPLILLTFAGYLLLFGNLGVACLNPKSAVKDIASTTV
ncbi:unnamed protein product [Haemonchus placei]|uniref:Cysteine-rich membrane protein 2 n=1 Tax=Haemonchus placei TaxID=6290 RepID=A0A0N4X6M9_HAEPC|nr:unnamed protein product [Haemonchus placei]